MLAAALLILVIKPWSQDAPPPSDRTALPSMTPGLPSTAKVAQPAPKASGQCEFAIGWRVFVAEAGDPIGERRGARRWLAIDPAAAASSPDDTSIPWVLVTTPALALGYCAPGPDGGGPPADAGMTAWAVARDGATAQMPLVDLSTGAAGAESTEGLFAPRPEAAPEASPPSDGRGHGWPEGRYVLRLSDRSGYVRWFGVELRYPPDPAGPPTLPHPSGTPSEAPPPLGAGGAMPGSVAMSGGLLRS